MPVNTEAIPSLTGQWGALLAGLPRQVHDDLAAQIDLAAPPDFFEFAKQALVRGATSRILLDDNLALRAATNPAVLSISQATELLQLAARLDPQIVTRLVRYLSSVHRIWPEEVPAAEALRVLALIENLPGLDRVMMSVLKLTRHPSEKVRSKSAKLFGKCASGVGAFERVYADVDARVRANLIQGIAERPLPLPEAFQDFLRRASADQHPRVLAMTLLALARCGDQVAAAALQKRCKHLNFAARQAARFAWKTLEQATSTSVIETMESN